MSKSNDSNLAVTSYIALLVTFAIVSDRYDYSY